MNPTIFVQKLHDAAQLPRYAHTGPFGDLAADLHAVAAHVLEPGATAAIATGLALGLPAGFGVLIADRSSLAIRGLHALAGVVDPGYRGEIMVVMHNLSAVPMRLEAGARIAQMRVVPLLQAQFIEVQELDATELDVTARHAGGFGSTGV